MKKIKLVSLSTTLATNAAVEGKGSRGTLILIGCDESTVRKNGKKYGLPDMKEIIFLKGGHTKEGEVISEPDWEILKQKVLQVKDITDGFAVVQLWGMRNSEFEKKAKDIIYRCTNLPVVCAHEMLGELNFLKRAATTLLNVKLIPIINNFLDAVKKSLKSKGINAPLVIVRGDGSLMNEDIAREKPLETLLSGPAASVIGGMNRSREKDCIVIDMGGTTSDIAMVKNGVIELSHEGVDVGQWKTGTRSINLKTIGLGGDSLIRFDNKDNLIIEPCRVTPLSWLVYKWPNVLESIKAIYDKKQKHTKSLCEFFYLVTNTRDTAYYYMDEEEKIVNALKRGPMDIMTLANKVDSSIYKLCTNRLESLGIIMRSALTPTDIMHITGDFRKWNCEAAQLGTKIMANRLDISMEELVLKINKKIKEKLYFNIVKMLMEKQMPNLYNNSISQQTKNIIMKGYIENVNPEDAYINCNFSTKFMLVGIGAPIHIYLKEVAKSLHTNYYIPEHACVANAIGTITGNVRADEKVIIKPVYEHITIIGYNCYSSNRTESFDEYDKALEWAQKEADYNVKEKIRKRGAGEVSIFVDVKESTLDTQLLETEVVARAIGTLKWLQDNK